MAFDPDEVRPEWDELERSGAGSAFQTQRWLDPWYRVIAPHFAVAPLFVAVTEHDSGQPLMLLPLCIRREGWLKVVEFPDLGVSDYNAPLVSPSVDLHGDAWRPVWREIRAALPRADLLRLDKVPARVGGAANPMAPLASSRRRHLSSWGVSLPPSRADYNRMLDASFAKELRRKGRRLEGRGAVSFRHAETEADGRAIFAELCKQRQSRFEELGRTNILADPVFRAFYEAVLFDDWPNSLAMLSALMVDDEIVAALFALRHRNSYHLIMSTFLAGPWKSSSPGNIVVDRAINAAIEAGVTYFDFTIGNEPYKRDFGATEEPLFAGQHPLSLAGLPQAITFDLKARLGNTALRRIRDRWRSAEAHAGA